MKLSENVLVRGGVGSLSGTYPYIRLWGVAVCDTYKLCGAAPLSLLVLLGLAPLARPRDAGKHVIYGCPALVARVLYAYQALLNEARNRVVNGALRDPQPLRKLCPRVPGGGVAVLVELQTLTEAEENEGLGAARPRPG